MESHTSPCPLGRPSGHARADALLACLSPWELLHLRNKFRNDDIKITGLATISDLPIDIMSMIVERLELEDIIRCRLVSRSWHATWAGGAAITAVCHHFFPGLLEKAAVDRDPRCAAELLQSCIKRYLWHKDCTHSESNSVRWEKDLGHATTIHEEFKLLVHVFYQQGLLVLKENETSVRVHDLTTDQHLLCNFSDCWIHGEIESLQAMSSNLLVFTIDTSLDTWPQPTVL
ncbi:hypothetical protein E4U42_000190 [Claviceps africana]|uniref:F-box domain-containing protein n=1 Tax=Claviceps africana TaxID=83212 RepID=A0A8K0J079_9HYPO|nr:hypothetical protein E4U42_000190 [Claviceps africana]